MKCSIQNIIGKKRVYMSLISLLILLGLTTCTWDVKPPKANPYKEDKTIHHSLYREKDSAERMSVYAQSIPQPHKE